MVKKTSIFSERRFPTAKQNAVSSVAYDYGTPQSQLSAVAQSGGNVIVPAFAVDGYL